jgi:uncharacterized protein (TIGR02646 family)
VIGVDRAGTKAPAELAGDDVRTAYEPVKAHFEAEERSSRQRVFRFEEEYFDAEGVRKALRELFAGKCAFCESPIEPASAGVTHHFRPTQEAVDADGAVSRPHYWWLAYEWENLYLACQACATAAGASFPVARERAPVGARGEELRGEGPQLLDPCADEPSEHLQFADDGSVVPLTDRGRHTIKTYALNRRELREARRAAIDEARSWPLDDRYDVKRPYAGAIRQAAAPPERALRPTPIMDRITGVLRSVFRAIPGTEPHVPVSAVVVERLELHDFRGIKHLELELAEPHEKQSWTVLLGENGSGKTTVLQALALVLMGDASRKQHEKASRKQHEKALDDLIRRGGAGTATIRAHLRGVIEPRTVRIVRGRGFVAEHAAADCALAAYGAARIPSSRDTKVVQPRSDRARVENLFDAASPLTSAQLWLAEKLDDDKFDFAGRALRQLLLRPEGTVLDRSGANVELRTGKESMELPKLSDGYRSVIALAADLMSFFMTRYGSMDAAEGVVLVDEIGAHLHPSWQMKVVGAFREAFPRLQFVVTTHDPLCLRGLGEGDVVVLRRKPDGDIFALPRDEVPPVSSLRVDELLTSEVFGLNSTIDPEVQSLFERYYALLASPDRENAERELAELREKLAAYRQLGSTRRERLVLEAADEYIARERATAEWDAREELLDSTKERLRAIWAGDKA